MLNNEILWAICFFFQSVICTGDIYMFVYIFVGNGFQDSDVVHISNMLMVRIMWRYDCTAGYAFCA